jgi:hypothetical protein
MPPKYLSTTLLYGLLILVLGANLVASMVPERQKGGAAGQIITFRYACARFEK